MIHIFKLQKCIAFTYYLNFLSTLYSSGYFEYMLLIVFVIFLLEFVSYALYPRLGGSKCNVVLRCLLVYRCMYAHLLPFWDTVYVYPFVSYFLGFVSS
jgi:hypothetical protein